MLKIEIEGIQKKEGVLTEFVLHQMLDAYLKQKQVSVKQCKRVTAYVSFPVTVNLFVNDEELLPDNLDKLKAEVRFKATEQLLNDKNIQPLIVEASIVDKDETDFTELVDD